MRRFEFKEGSSNKFWEVSVSANTLTVRFGGIGTEGQEKSKTFASAALAEKEQDKLVAEKQGKGYKEVGPPSAGKRAPAAAPGNSASPASEAADSALREVQGCKVLENAAPKLGSMKRISIRLTGVPSKNVPVGKSKLGGRPDLPAGVEWPEATTAGVEIALPFVAQINLAQVHHHDVEGLLPESGMLYFFYYSYNYGDYFSPVNWRVLYHSGTDAAYSPSSPPKPIPPHLEYNPRALKFTTEVTLPRPETCFIGAPGDTSAKLGLTQEEWDTYIQLLYELRANKSMHQMLGYSDDAQPYAMENGYENVRDKFFPGSSPFKSLTPDEQNEEFFQGRLLLQIDEEKSIKMRIGYGRLYFFVREQDLKAKDFSKVWVTEQ